jgi:predicted TIM-barrel fold metal-dependent hydrolase
MTSVLAGDAQVLEDTAPAVLITSDSHIGPRMVEDLRPYCPAKHLQAYDGFLSDIAPVREWWATSGAPGLESAGHYDSDARVKDLERDGYVGEVLFHFSFNGEMIPFVPMLASSDSPTDLGLAAVGLRMYNRWLSDFCAGHPGRVGLAYLPYWDLDLAVKEVEWAAKHGLKGVNFPAMRDNILPYDDPSYESFWAACAAHDMPLTTHAGAVSPSSQTHEYLAMLEAGGAPNRRAIHRLIFSGIFERYPNLKLVMTEQPGLWQKPLMDEMDSVYRACTNPNRGGMSVLSKKTRKMEAPSNWKGYAVNTIPLQPLAKLPSEYFLSNVWTGASYMAHFEAEAAIDGGYTDVIMYGTDYPHPEGSWKAPETEDEPSQVIRALQVTFENLRTDRIREMVGLNAARCYNLDIDALRLRANKISAPSPAKLAEATDGPRVGIGGTGGMAFRKTGTWF